MALSDFRDTLLTGDRNGLLWFFFLGIVFLVGGSQAWAKSVDPREPQEVKPKIPLVGHIIGLLGSRQKYYRQLGYVESQLIEV